jgi:phosphoribosylglycinamide formyltransferase-1
MSANRLRLAVCLSGSGRTLQNLLDLRQANGLDAEIAIVIASRSGVGGIERAAKAGVPHVVADRKLLGDADFNRRVFELIDEAQADLIILAGWLHLLNVPPRYVGRVMNIHPALLPSFGGRGMWGDKVHQAVLDQGCKVSGCTVHFVDQSYDTGPIILQRTCPVLENDSCHDLAERVFEEEKIALPAAIRLFQQGRLKIEARRVRVRPVL